MKFKNNQEQQKTEKTPSEHTSEEILRDTPNVPQKKEQKPQEKPEVPQKKEQKPIFRDEERDVSAEEFEKKQAAKKEARKKEKKSALKRIIRIVITALCVCLAIALIYCAVAFIGRAILSGKCPTDEEALIAKAEELIPESVKINDIVWGEGIPAVDDAEELESVTGAQYRRCNTSVYGYANVTELKEACTSVYTYDIVSSAFEDTDAELGVYARYKDDSYVDEDGQKQTVLFCNIDAVEFPVNQREFDLSSVKYKGATYVWNVLWWKLDYVTITVDVTESDGQTEARDFNLEKVDGEWVLSTATY